MEVVGLIGICLAVVNSMSNSYLYVYDIPNVEPKPNTITAFDVMDIILTLLFVLVYVYLIKRVFGKAKEHFRK